MPTYVTENGHVMTCQMGRDSYGVYYCTGHDFSTESKQEWQAHKSEAHPIWCSHHGVGEYIKAAYRYDNGKYYYDYCAECADERWDSNATFRERVERQPREANEDAERLAEDHPVEQALNGSGGDSE